MTRPMKVLWSQAEDDHLLFLRDREKLRFCQIGLRLGRTPEACEVRYYGRLFAVNGAKHYGQARGAGRPVGGSKPRPEKVVRPIEPQIRLPEPRACRAVNLDALREMAELRLRIAERGLTGGVFGDPRPGRSALDERTKAAAGRRAGPFRGGSDVR
ncbi:hypothetical protein [Bradyrhizobium tunisiense]|uniref:hypothetical protein n=1 Tax=Bradyrhizobium tunisiense TaxID=3278709 RepID=UPI0035E222E7